MPIAGLVVAGQELDVVVAEDIVVRIRMPLPGGGEQQVPPFGP